MSQNPTSQPNPEPSEVTVINEALKPFTDKVTLIVTSYSGTSELVAAGIEFSGHDANIGVYTGTLDEVFKLITECSLAPNNLKVIGKGGVMADFIIEPPKYCLQLDGYVYEGADVPNAVVRFRAGNYIIPPKKAT